MEEIARTFRKPEYQPVNYLTHHFWSLPRRLPQDTSLPEPPVPHSPVLVLVPRASLPPHPGCVCAQQAGPTESCLSPAGCLGLEIKRLGAADPWPPTHEAARRLGGPPCAESEQVRVWGPARLIGFSQVDTKSSLPHQKACFCHQPSLVPSLLPLAPEDRAPNLHPPHMAVGVWPFLRQFLTAPGPSDLRGPSRHGWLYRTLLSRRQVFLPYSHRTPGRASLM